MDPLLDKDRRMLLVQFACLAHGYPEGEAEAELEAEAESEWTQCVLGPTLGHLANHVPILLVRLLVVLLARNTIQCALLDTAAVLLR